jgi:TetR/AcrR family transcriptional repressor of nem operon
VKDTKEHILKVSFGLFLQKSFKEVTMKEIVEKTGMSKGAFYHYFNSKEQIYLEIINSAFSSVLYVDYNQFSSNSLHEFYHDYISYLNRIYDSLSKVEDNSSFDLNYYSLIFDAIRLFPDFKEKMVESTRVDLEAWVKIIRTAKEQGEVKSSMSDDQLANVFIYTNSGISMENLMTGRSEDITKSLLKLWDSFYAQIKQ